MAKGLRHKGSRDAASGRSRSRRGAFAAGTLLFLLTLGSLPLVESQPAGVAEAAADGAGSPTPVGGAAAQAAREAAPSSSGEEVLYLVEGADGIWRLQAEKPSFDVALADRIDRPRARSRAS